MLILTVFGFRVQYSLDGSRFIDRGIILVATDGTANFAAPIPVPMDWPSSSEVSYYIKLQTDEFEMIKQVPLVITANSAC